MWETWVRSLCQEDPLEKEMAPHSGILAWRIPWMEELGGLQSTGRKELDTTSLSLSIVIIKHWLYSLCGTLYFVAYFIYNSLYF